MYVKENYRYVVHGEISIVHTITDGNYIVYNASNIIKLMQLYNYSISTSSLIVHFNNDTLFINNDTLFTTTQVATTKDTDISHKKSVSAK